MKKILFILASLTLAGCASDQDALEACQDKADAWKLRATLDLHHALAQPTMQQASLQKTSLHPQKSSPEESRQLAAEASREIEKAYSEKAAMCEHMTLNP